MWTNWGKKEGWLCLPPTVLKIIGWLLIAAGGLLIVVFVPVRYWMALIGVLLMLAGIWLNIR